MNQIGSGQSDHLSVRFQGDQNLLHALPTAIGSFTGTQRLAFKLFSDPIGQCNNASTEEERAECELKDQHSLKRFRDEEIVLVEVCEGNLTRWEKTSHANFHCRKGKQLPCSTESYRTNVAWDTCASISVKFGLADPDLTLRSIGPTGSNPGEMFITLDNPFVQLSCQKINI